MNTFRDLVLSIEITEKEHEEFVLICSEWALFCAKLSTFDKLKVIKLLKYLITERTKSKKMLERSIGRFNRLNTLVKETLCRKKK